MKPLLLLCMSLAPLAAADLDTARALYQRTDYAGALAALAARSDAPALTLAGQCLYGQRDYPKAIETLLRAQKLAPRDAAIAHWLGRAWGRRAEKANPFQAFGFANKTRDAFELAVKLDPARIEAASDLLEYYLEAPGFLGGGIDKAEPLAETHLKPHNPAQYHFARARIAEKRKQTSAAEREYRKAAELDPKSSGRLADLALFLARHNRLADAEALFSRAARLEPNSPAWRFSQAHMYAEYKEKQADARRLLQEYLKLPLTPDDPPREEAQALLKRLR